jgi:predicted HTH transcriptional regulator
MFDVRDTKSVLTLDQTFLGCLPEDENEELEYKSSATPDAELGNKISKAASAFWNSGGGLFIAGVNDAGKVDGGIGTRCGREDRRSWIDKQIAKTHPYGPFEIHAIPQGADVAVYLIGFGISHQLPHMAFDKKYYIRCGVHSEPAPHGIVEAIRAYRVSQSPRLVHISSIEYATLDMKKYEIYVEIFPINDVPAMDVKAEIVVDGNKYNPVKPSLFVDRSQPLRFSFEAHVAFKADLALLKTSVA